LVIKNGRASIALDLLLQTYRSIQPASEALFPVINSSDQEELTNLICAVSLAGDASQWGVAIPVFTSLAGFLRYLGAETLSETRGIENGVLSQAVMVCLRSVPERRVDECVRLIRNVVNAADFLENDWSTMRSLDSDEVCRVVRQITAEPVSQHLITQIFGTVYGGAAITTRARPSGGSASLLCRLQAIDWQDGLLGGMGRIRESAQEALALMEPDYFLCCEWWGSGIAGCPENCVNCPANGADGNVGCYSLARGLI